MKLFISLCLILISTGTLCAQSVVPGYYVSQTNDTVKVQIKIPQVISNLLDKVTIIDSINGDKKFRPGDIKSYGFSYKGTAYRFYSKPVHRNGIKNPKNGLNKFIQAVIVGPKTSIYEYRTTSTGGYGISYGNVLYVFEKPDGSYTFLSLSSTLNKCREILEEFYKNDPGILQLIGTKFQNRGSIQSDIKEIAQAVNNS